jgi:hypothetical protein
MKQLLDTAKDLDEKRQRELNKIQDNHTPETLTHFERHTAWSIKYKTKDMGALVELMKKPDEKEHWLLQAWNNMRSMIVKHFDGIWDLYQHNWHVIPFWLASAYAEEAESVPFRRYFDTKSIDKYAEIWQRYIIFCLNMYNNNNEYDVQFTSEQEDCLKIGPCSYIMLL